MLNRTRLMTAFACMLFSLAGLAGCPSGVDAGDLPGGDDTDGLPPIVANAGLDGFIEAGEDIALVGSASGGSGVFSYSWSPATGLDDATSRTPVASPRQTTVYALTVTDSRGSTAVDTATITVLPALVADAGPNITVSAGDSVTLQGSASGGDAASGYGYEWSPATGLDDPTAAQPTFIATQTTTFTLTVTDGPGRVSTDQVTVTVLP